jgi:hypothetical protein
MAKITIPREYRDALAEVATMPSEAFDEILSVLHGAGDSQTTTAIVNRAKKQVSGLEEATVEKTVSALLSLAMFRAASNRSAEKLAHDVSEQLATDIRDIPVSTARLRLEQVLALASIATGSKAMQLLQDHQRVFEKATILSDIRPVFEGDSLSGAVMVHNLKISFREGGERKECFFALDEHDLTDLYEAIKRAESKSKAIRIMLERSETKLFSFQEDE